MGMLSTIATLLRLGGTKSKISDKKFQEMKETCYKYLVDSCRFTQQGGTVCVLAQDTMKEYTKQNYYWEVYTYDYHPTPGSPYVRAEPKYKMKSYPTQEKQKGWIHTLYNGSTIKKDFFFNSSTLDIKDINYSYHYDPSLIERVFCAKSGDYMTMYYILKHTDVLERLRKEFPNLNLHVVEKEGYVTLESGHVSLKNGFFQSLRFF